MPARLAALIPGAAPPIALNRPVLLVGRHPECDIRLDLPAISRRHCCLAMADDRIVIRDLGSRHGVMLNGRPVDEARLRPGDEVAIGPLLYRFEDAPAPEPPPAPESARPRPPAADDHRAPLPVDFGDLDFGDLGLRE
jgi:predicted component of type VI protein secretion system